MGKESRERDPEILAVSRVEGNRYTFYKDRILVVKYSKNREPVAEIILPTGAVRVEIEGITINEVTSLLVRQNPGVLIKPAQAGIGDIAEDFREDRCFLFGLPYAAYQVDKPVSDPRHLNRLVKIAETNYGWGIPDFRKELVRRRYPDLKDLAKRKWITEK